MSEDASKKPTFSAVTYFKEAQALKIKVPVSVVQRQEVLAYLRGEVETNASIDVHEFDKANAGNNEADMAGEESKEADGDRSSKRQRVGDSFIPLKPVSEWSVEDITREEVQLSTHLSLLQTNKKNLSPVLSLFHKANGGEKRKESSRDSKSSASKAAEKARAAPTLNPNNPNFGIPIIVVPAAVSAVLNMYNVTQLLENGVFVSGDEIRMKNPTLKKPTIHTISRSSFYDPTKQVKYQVIDDVTQLKSNEDWSRVVGVFVLGAAWQFADWPKERWTNPAAIFENVCAFHLHFDDEALHPNILNWRTHRLPISKSKRHGDRGVVLDFWRILTEFVAAKNAQKRLNI